MTLSRLGLSQSRSWGSVWGSSISKYLDVLTWSFSIWRRFSCRNALMMNAVHSSLWWLSHNPAGLPFRPFAWHCWNPHHATKKAAILPFEASFVPLLLVLSWAAAAVSYSCFDHIVEWNQNERVDARNGGSWGKKAPFTKWNKSGLVCGGVHDRRRRLDGLIIVTVTPCLEPRGLSTQWVRSFWIVFDTAAWLWPVGWRPHLDVWWASLY